LTVPVLVVLAASIWTVNIKVEYAKKPTITKII